MNCVLYHKNCTDGFMSAFLLHQMFKELGKKVELVPVNYNELIPDVFGKDVLIVDFSFTPEDMRKLSCVAKSIIVLDHHKTAADLWGGYVDHKVIPADDMYCEVQLSFKEDMSGAGMVYEYIKTKYPGLEMLKNGRLQHIVDCVQDRDLWNFYYEDTKCVYELLKMVPETFEDWEYVLVYERDEAYSIRFQKARNYYEVKESLAQKYASLHQFIQFQGFTIPIVNCPANFTSRIGEILDETNPFAMMYCLSTTQVYCSMRSRKEGGENVAEIAKKFGGGGHINSAGFGLKPEQLVDLLKGKL